MGKMLVAVVVSMLGVGLAAIMLGLLYPPTVGTREMVAYLVTMLAVAVGVIVANVWAAGRGGTDSKGGGWREQ